MIAYTVETSSLDSGFWSAVIVRTPEQAARLSAVLNDAPTQSIEVNDAETIEYLLSEEHLAEHEEYIARILKRKN